MPWLWTLLNALIGALSFLASALMLKRLWGLVPLSVRSVVRNGLALILFILGVLGSVSPRHARLCLLNTGRRSIGDGRAAEAHRAATPPAQLAHPKALAE
jgi:hypothetical protein